MTSEYQRIENAIAYLDSHVRDQPSLEDIASHVGLSPFHFQRMFRRWAGISPKRFLEYLTVNHAKTLLRQSKNVFDTTYELGLSSPSRLHDHFVSIEAMTPGEHKNKGLGIEITYGFQDTPFGKALIAQTKRGICMLSFIKEGPREQYLEMLRQTWMRAAIHEDQRGTSQTADRIFKAYPADNACIHLLVHGTNFQISVWKALLKIPEGAVVTYKLLAEYIGRPTAYRAVANAVSVNPIAFLIPCHRVLRATGEFGGYRWGKRRKRAILAWESPRSIRGHGHVQS
jgi:AraC family transcriptional regulator of adaptative response/methylated-DNA-[protein]-cysteine methyltransferase